MMRTSPIARLRLLALIAPIVLLIAAALLATGIYLMGQTIDFLQQQPLAALDAAHAMDTALYKMEWARSRADREQILFDQRRQFNQSLQTARDLALGNQQRVAVQQLIQQVDTALDALRTAAPDDDSAERAARHLHESITDLISADVATLSAQGDQLQQQAYRLIGLTLFAAVLVPWLCFAGIAMSSAKIRAGLRSLRQQLDSAQPRSIAPQSALSSIDETLDSLGFPRPNPMLSDDA